jgi:hypothetical protein
VDEKLLRPIAFGGGGFGVSDDVPKYLELRIRDYLSRASFHVAIFELLAGIGNDAAKSAQFPSFSFAPSLYATSDGKAWTRWSEGSCAFLTASDVIGETLRNVLVESDWGKGIVFLLPISEADKSLLQSGAVWDANMLDRLLDSIEAVIVPAHNREAIVILERSDAEDISASDNR